MNLPIAQLASHPTPFYFYDMALLYETLQAIKEASSTPGFCVHYAVKANANEPILRAIAQAGFGADTVSGGEILRALSCGFSPEKIVFAGVGKSDAEITLALSRGISCLNVESAEELAVIEQTAARMGLRAPVALRVNPEIDAHTHHYITTALAENKFGIAMSRLLPLVSHILSSPSLQFRGLHFHIGSQITTLEPYRLLCSRIITIQDLLATHGIQLPAINVGGGLGVDYAHPLANPNPDFSAYFSTFRDHLPLRPGQQLHFELGRSVVAQCGALISRVLYVKQGVDKQFVILDAGMTDLIRPALYQASHAIINLTAAADPARAQLPEQSYDIVGPICESSDTFATDRPLPPTLRGDLIAILSAGAYGQIMSSGYNLRPLPPAIYSTD